MDVLHYWISTADAEAGPISRPIDGMWMDTALYCSGDPNVRWRRSLMANPKASVNLEDAERPVILEGAVTMTTPDLNLAATFAEMAQAKYGWGSVELLRNEICVFRPRQAMTWRGVFEQATRFRFVDVG